jgi:hypothetical protein
MRSNATCPAMPSANEKTADRLVNRRVRPLIVSSVASHGENEDCAQRTA